MDGRRGLAAGSVDAAVVAEVAVPSAGKYGQTRVEIGSHEDCGPGESREFRPRDWWASSTNLAVGEPAALAGLMVFFCEQASGFCSDIGQR